MGARGGVGKAVPMLSIGVKDALRMLMFTGLCLRWGGRREWLLARKSMGPLPAGHQGSGNLRCPDISRTGPRHWCTPGHQPQIQKGS